MKEEVNFEEIKRIRREVKGCLNNLWLDVNNLEA